MNYDKGFGFVGGFALGGLVGAAIVLLMAPASGEETRDQIRSEAMSLKRRGQDYGDDKMHDAKKMVKKGQRGVSDAQSRLGDAIQDQKDHFNDAVDAGKDAAGQRKEELVSRVQDMKARVS